jgi:nitroreductase
MPQDILSIIYNRKSVRNYKNGDKQIPQEAIDKIIKAAFAAPSAINIQPWHFIVVKERVLLDALADKLPYAKMLRETPLAIIVCGDTDKSELYWDMDCAAATQNILLAAEALELGAVWTAVHPEPDRISFVKKLLHIPRNITPLNVIPIGYAALCDAPKNKYDASKIHINAW